MTDTLDGKTTRQSENRTSIEPVLQYNVPFAKAKLNSRDSNDIPYSTQRNDNKFQRQSVVFLNFTPELELKFQVHVKKKYTRHLNYMNGTLCIFSLSALIEYVGRAGTGGGSAFVVRSVLTGLALFNLALVTVSSATGMLDIKSNKSISTCIYTISGCLLSLADVYGNDVTNTLTSAVTTIAFLISYHTLGKIFLFPYIASATIAVNACYIIAALLMRPSEDRHFTVYHILTVVFTSTFLCYATHKFEARIRRSFLSRLKAEHDKMVLEHEKHQLMEGTNEIREDIYKGIIQKIDQSGGFVISSPAETMMHMLKKLQEKVRLPPRAFQGVNKIISILGRSNDIFKPHVKRDLQRRSMIGGNGNGNDIKAWILDLVNNDEDGSVNPRPSSATGGRSLEQGNASLTPNPISSEQKARDRLLEKLDHWNFDVFEAEALTKGHGLLLLTITIFQRYNFIQKFNIDPIKLRNFVSQIEAGYINNPYHNSVHASDVVRTTHYFLKVAGIKDYMKDHEMLAAIVAAVIHDFEHPGVSNNFLVATKHEYAILYNDTSVLENHHLAAAFRILQKSECDIFENLKPEQKRSVRKNIINLVLATDLANHFGEIGRFSTSVASENVDKKDGDTRLMILRIAIKCADLGHVAKSFDQHRRWTGRITEEMYLQGDTEKKIGMKPSPIMDRDANKNIAKSQLGFIKFLVEPMYKEFICFLEKDDRLLKLPCLKQLKSNLAYWEGEAKNMKSKKDKEIKIHSMKEGKHQ